jgi:hypothetical protein
MQASIAMWNGESAFARPKAGPLRVLAMAHLRGTKKHQPDVLARADGNRFAVFEMLVAQM